NYDPSSGVAPMKLRLAFGLFVAVSTLAAQRGQAPAGTASPAANAAPGGARGATPPGINWPSPALPDGPIILDTGIQHQIVLYVTKGLNQPWSMAFLPDGAILITERGGRLRIVRNGRLDPNPVV